MRILFFLFILCFSSTITYAAPDLRTELEEAKQRIRELESENRALRERLGEADIAIEAPPRASQESAKAEKPKGRRGFIDLNYYYDTRDFQNITVNAGAQLPLDFRYYQLLTLKSPLNTIKAKRSDLTDFITEINLRRPIWKDDPWWGAVDWTLQYVDASFFKDLTRLGARVHFHKLPDGYGDFFRETLGLRYSLDFHFYESDGEGWQLEHVYNRQFMDGLFYLKGFIDQSFDPRGFFVVQEHQIGYRLFDNFYAVTELRYKTNNRRRDKWGVGIGAEYIIRF